jgi:two-component system, LytTR family, sensor kinase
MKRYLIGRIGMYFLLWLILSFFLLYLYYDSKAPFWNQFLVTLIVTAMTYPLAYYTARVLVPRFLYHKKIRDFIVSVLLAAFVNTILTYFIAGGIYGLLSSKPVFTSGSYLLIVSSFLFIINCIVAGISSAAQIITDHFGMEHQLYEAQNEKIRAELSYLRAQINPHFLFNVLNTIYFQINKENSEARNSVEILSGMLRYQLYECNTDLIDISSELTYIRNYVAIQQLRMEPGTDLKVMIPDVIDTFKIAPLIILPLIENAFKYLSNNKDSSQNKLYITINNGDDSSFIVQVMNTFSDLAIQPNSSNGLGLKNMKRRLELLYPDTHSLVTERIGNIFKVTLKIQKYD